MAETLSNGVVIPQGTDLIHGSGVQAMRNLGGSVNTALTGKANTAHTHPDLVARLAALEYDSGELDISALLADGFSATSVRLLRIGQTVALHVTNLAYTGGATGAVTVAVIPAGFRPPSSAYMKTARNLTALVTSGGAFQIVNPAASVDSVTFTFLTTNPEPTETPGTVV